MCHNFNFLQEIVKTGDLSWDNVDYFCHWQSQILNHAKFSGELEIDNYCDISDEVKYNINDDITSNENIENVDKSMDPFIDDDDLETNENIDAENLVSMSFNIIFRSTKFLGSYENEYILENVAYCLFNYFFK